MAGPDLSGAAWRRSSRSTGANDCVEVAEIDKGVAVRDSKDRCGSVLRFDREVWQAFVGAVRHGIFDLPT